MRHFILFIILVFIGLFCLQDAHFFSRTNNGERFESFKTETSVVLPPILANYLRESHVRYSIYKVPNYVGDFLTYNKDFSLVYSSAPKYSVIIFKPKDYVKANATAFEPFYERVQKSLKNYSKSFNLIVIEETVKPKYLLHNDRVAYKDLKKYCGSFCVINPTEWTMFVFNRITKSEVEALDVLFQQYDFNK